MNCPICNCDTKVTDSRQDQMRNIVRRRRRCLTCGHTFSTVECDRDHFSKLTENYFNNLAKGAKDNGR